MELLKQQDLLLAKEQEIREDIKNASQPRDMIRAAVNLSLFKEKVETAKKAFKAEVKAAEQHYKEAEALADELEGLIKDKALITYVNQDVIKTNDATGEVKVKTLDNLGKKAFTYTSPKTTITVDKEALLSQGKFTKTITVIDEAALAAHIELLGLEGLPTISTTTPAKVGLQWAELKKTKLEELE